MDMQLDKQQLRTLVQETMQALTPFYQAQMRQAIQDAELPDNWFGLNLARGSAPAPFSVDRYHALFPYTARKQFADDLDRLAELELLERVGEGAYRITDVGREAVEAVFEAAHLGMGAVEPLPADDMDRLNGLLQRVVTAALRADEPAEKWALIYSRWPDPGEDAPATVRVDQYLTDLMRYRDDAHIAAWKPYDVSGPAWEAFTLVWRGEASTAEELAEALPYRGYTADEYDLALQALADRGWVERTADGAGVTETGDQLRQEAEEATDRYYFAPWDCLSAAEVDQLQVLLTRLKEALDKLAESINKDGEEDSPE